MTRHVVTQPAHQDRLRQVSAARDGEDGKVARPDGHGCLAEQYHIAHSRNETARQCEQVSVPESVAGISRGEGDDRGDAVDRDTHDLGADGGPS